MGREEKVSKVILVDHLQQNPSPLIPKSFCIQQAKQGQHKIKRLDYKISHISEYKIEQN